MLPPYTSALEERPLVFPVNVHGRTEGLWKLWISHHFLHTYTTYTCVHSISHSVQILHTCALNIPHHTHPTHTCAPMSYTVYILHTYTSYTRVHSISHTTHILHIRVHPMPYTVTSYTQAQHTCVPFVSHTHTHPTTHTCTFNAESFLISTHIPFPPTRHLLWRKSSSF